ncbi:MAG: amidohydrolase family protein, partial [Candidatus Omnitrophota bacterium]|nr:amidohydrolase family protein [Candidatus Omnitrophota bacterium]
ILSLGELILKMSVNPSRILGINRGMLKEGSAANVVIFDPAEKYIYKRETIESKSKNSPFIGWELKGKVQAVFVNGHAIHS